MAGGSSDRIPVLEPGKDRAYLDDLQPVAAAAARKIYDEVSSSTVYIRTDRAIGSGFFADNNGEVITDAHVIDDAQEIKVRTTTGEYYRARVEKIDEVHDLAVLEIEGPVKQGQSYVKLGESDALKPNQDVYALGHPLGDKDLSISPGQVQKLETESDFLTALGADVNTELAKARKVLSPKQFEEVEQELGRQMVQGNVHIDHGNSGGPLVGKDGKLVGVADLGDTANPSNSLFTKSEDVDALLKQKHPTFEFKYGYSSEQWTNYYKSGWRTNPVGTGIGTGLAADVAVAVATKFPYATGVIAAYAGFAQLLNDGDELIHSRYRRDTIKYALATGTDLAVVGGGVASMVPEWRKIGLAVLGIGVVGRMASDFIKNRLVLTDKHPAGGDKSSGSNAAGAENRH